MVSSHPLSAARARLGKITAAVRYSNEPALITDHGEAAAVLVSPEWFMSRRDETKDPSLNDLLALPPDSGGV